MITPPERSPERDAAIDAMLPRVPVEGWTRRALRGALADIGADPEDAVLLFPGGAADMVEAFIDLADRRMGEGIDASALAAARLPARVRMLIAHRLASFAVHKDAVRRGFAILALPANGRVAARSLARTVDEIWHLAGDTSADFAWYTKRATLAGVYGATLIYWLRDHSEDDAATLAFLDRRLAGVARITALRRRVQNGVRLPCLRRPCNRRAAA